MRRDFSLASAGRSGRPRKPIEPLLRATIFVFLLHVATGAAVDPIYRHTHDLAETARNHREADLHQLAADALARVAPAA